MFPSDEADFAFVPEKPIEKSFQGLSIEKKDSIIDVDGLRDEVLVSVGRVTE